MPARKSLIAGVIIVAVALVAGLTYFTQIVPISNTPPPAARSTQTVQVTIPEDAYLPPEGWKGGYVYSEKYYSPVEVKISIGDTVEWVNRDSLAHTMTFHKAPGAIKTIDSGPLEANRSWRFTFNTPGEYEYHCSFHPWAAAKIVAE